MRMLVEVEAHIAELQAQLAEVEAHIAELQAQLAEVEAQQNGRPNLHTLPDGEWQAELEARKPFGRKRAELVKTIAEQEKVVNLILWDLAPMSAVPLLATLRDAIVNGPEPPKRTPKWRFKVADDFGIQLQAKDKERVLFEGLALQGDGVTGDSFKENRSEHAHLWRLKFDIRPNGEKWWIKPTFARYGDMETKDRETRERVATRELIQIKERIIKALGSIFKDGQIPLLEDYCLICGHRLTDAVSRSRPIGPECWGNSSNLVPLRIGRLLTGEEVAR